MAIFQPKWRGPDGETVTGKVWWIDAWVGSVRCRRSLGTRDKNAASILAGEIVKRLEMKEAGVPVFEGTADACPLDLVTEYEAELRRRGSAAQHVQRTIQRLRDTLEGVERLSEVTPQFVRRALTKVAEKGLSGATQNGYRVALSGLFGWLVAEERWPTNPVTHVEPVAKGEPTRTRRALTREELDRLVAAAGRRRGVAYLFAATTGLRRSEMAALRWADVDLDAATVTVRAATAKNRKDAVQPLPAGTVTALRAHRGLRQPEDRVFDSVPSTKGLRADLRAAGLAYDDGTGICDFHAVGRVTYATLLARGGVPLVQAQRLMRHSTPTLTANVYTKLRIEDAREAVSRIDGGAPQDSRLAK
jgi:integrase